MQEFHLLLLHKYLGNYQYQILGTFFYLDTVVVENYKMIGNNFVLLKHDFFSFFLVENLIFFLFPTSRYSVCSLN